MPPAPYVCLQGLNQETKQQLDVSLNKGVEPSKHLLHTTSPERLPSVDISVTAWLQVLGGFLVMFNTWGIALSYGVFQAYYNSGNNVIVASPSAVAWIGSGQAALLLLVGGICGRIFDAGYLRHLLLAGWFLLSFGLAMTSLGHVYWQIFLSQSLCVGIGMGCLLVPSVGTVGTWFVRYRGVAFGIVSSGGAVGGVVLPIMLQKLLDDVGFGWALRVLSFISLITLGISALLLRQRVAPRSEGPLFEWAALKQPEFALFTFGYLLVSMGFYILPQFVQSWADATNFSKSFSTTYYLPIIHATSIPGRILLNLASDHIGPLNVQIPCIFVTATVVFTWIAVKSLVAMLIITIMYGFASGGLLALPLAVLAKLTEDNTRLGARMGVFFVSEAIGVLIGTPVAGAVLGQNNQGGDWTSIQIWGGAMIFAGGLLICGSRAVVSQSQRRLLITT